MEADVRTSVLRQRGIVRVSGPEARGFLHGLVSNDIARLTPDAPAYALLLSPQGKILFDFIVVQHGDDFLLDCERQRAPQLAQRLTLYKLRAKVGIVDESDRWQVAVSWRGDGAPVAADSGEGPEGALAYPDPRLPALGRRNLVPADAPAGSRTPATIAAYTARRFSLGVAEGSADLGIEALFALEANAEPLHGVDFRKGCYVGQELTARMKHRATVRKRILPATFAGAAPAPGSPVHAGDKVLGAVCSVHEDRALVLLRLDGWAQARAGGTPLRAEGAELAVSVPGWLAPHLDPAILPPAAASA